MSVERLLQELNVDYRTSGHHHCTRGWANVDCPHCSPDSRHYRMGVHLQTAACSCWYCGKKRAGEVLALVARRPLREVLPLLKAARTSFRPDFDQEHTGVYAVPFPVGPLLGVHKRFLAGRRLDPERVVADWQVGGVGLDGGQHKWRLFLPVVTGGRPVSWTTRSVTDDSRYRSAAESQEAVPHKHLLYGLDHVRHSCLVVEGPTGCWRVGPGTVATFGTAFTPPQVALLAQVPVRYVAFDPEPEAQRRAAVLCDQLGGMSGVTELIKLDPGTDPGSLDDKQVRQLRKLVR